MAKQINTRILLKYDSYENWQASSFILKKGEAAICEMKNTVDQAAAPTILVKFGDGEKTFSQLPWSSALAADVYAWAKESGIKTEKVIAENASAADGSVEVFVGAEFKATETNPNGALVFTCAYAAKASDITAALADYATKTDVATAKQEAITAASGDATTKANAALASAKEYADQNFLSKDAEVGYDDTVLTNKVTALETTVNGAEGTEGLVAKVENLTTNKADKSAVDAMYTNTQIDALVQGAKDYADANDANDNTEYHVEYDSVNKKIKLVAGADANKMEIDATDFIKDGMIDTVTIGADNDLIITFNTAAGKENIVLPLDQLVDTYTGGKGITITDYAVAIDESVVATKDDIAAAKAEAADGDAVVLSEAQVYAKKYADDNFLLKTEYEEYDDTVLSGKVTALETAVGDENSGLVKDVADLEAEVAGLALGDKNVIESVKVNNTALTVTDKAVNIDLTGYRAKADKITSDDLSDEVFIFNCGDADTNID